VIGVYLLKGGIVFVVFEGRQNVVDWSIQVIRRKKAKVTLHEAAEEDFVCNLVCFLLNSWSGEVTNKRFYRLFGTLYKIICKRFSAP
jgi:hypothetical protein